MDIKRARETVKKEVDKIRAEVKGGLLFGFPVEEFGEDGLIFFVRLLSVLERTEMINDTK